MFQEKVSFQKNVKGSLKSFYVDISETSLYK